MVWVQRLRRGRAAQLLVEAHEIAEPEPAHRGSAVGDDVVRSLEHPQLVARQERRRDALEQRGRASGQPERHVNRGTPRTERRLETAPELAPRDRLRAAELDRPIAPSASTARRTARTRSSIQIGCTRCVPGPITGVTGESLRFGEPRQRTSVGAEDEARAQHGVVDARRRDRLLGRPLGTEVRDGRARPGPEGAHQHDAADVALARRLDEVPGPGRHHALECRGRPLDDRDEVDDRAHAAGRGAERRPGRSRRRVRARSRRLRASPRRCAVRTIARTRPARRAARASRDDRRTRSRR